MPLCALTNKHFYDSKGLCICGRKGTPGTFTQSPAPTEGLPA